VYTCPPLEELGDRECLVLEVRVASPMAPVRLEVEVMDLMSDGRSRLVKNGVCA